MMSISSSKKFDIVIVGGGPAGSYFANLMSGEGFDVALIEQKKYPNFWDKICGSVAGKTFLKNVNVEESRVVKNEFSSFSVRDFQGEKLSEVYVDLIVIDRIEAGKEILEEARDNGVKIVDNKIVRELIMDSKGVRGVGFEGRVGEGGKIFSRLVVDASGTDGILREKLKHKLPETEFVQDDLVMAYMEKIKLDKSPYTYEDLQLFISKENAPGGYAWITPVGEEVISGIGAMLSLTSRATLIENLAKVKNMEGIRGNIELSGIGVLPVRRPFSSFVYNGFALIGDSGSQGNPFFGGGIEGAIEAAKIAFRTLKKGLEVSENKVVSIEDLWIYNYEFMTKRGVLLAMIDLLRMVAQSLNDKELQTIAKNMPKSLQFDLLTLLSIGMKLSGLLFRPRFLWKTVELVKVSQKVKEMYLRYPKEPEELEDWIKKVEKVYKKFKKSISKM